VQPPYVVSLKVKGHVPQGTAAVDRAGVVGGARLTLEMLACFQGK
jgi:hypothetical protein